MVTFDADGGSPGEQKWIVNSGGSVGAENMPGEPEKSGCVFDGWYTERNGGGSQFTADTPVSEDITVYAKWINNGPVQHTVTFDADGGSPGTQSRTVNSGSSVGSSNMPANPAMPLNTFGGWYTERNGGGTEFTASTVVSGNMTVYAKWAAMYQSLDENLAWINDNAVEGGAYTITLTSHEFIVPVTLFCGGKNVSVTLGGDAEKRTVYVDLIGSLFTVENGVTLTLDNNIVLRGRNDNNAALVRVKSGGKLVMNTGSEISGNIASSGGGVYVDNGGTFTMEGGTISDNTASSGGGGGVYISGGTFTMSNGTISGNTASSGDGVYVGNSGTFTMAGGTISGNTRSSGGGVYVSGGTFTMNNGTISGNTRSSGGGVYVSGGTFTMNNGTISGNTASSGGGVYVGNSGTFTMAGGTISGNTRSSSGGGVYVSSSMFTMSGGEISGNTASSSGGGVYISGGTFTMNNGEISGNTAYSSYGGGVYVGSGTFSKDVRATIYGSNARDALKNTASQGDSYGHAVYVSSGGKKRNTTAGWGVALDSVKSGVVGGWE
jgi:uncharacterized repeat protein (TIGR02543 family)